MQVQNLPITRTTTIEVLIPNNTTSNQFAFPDMPYLRNRKITAITLSPGRNTIQSGRDNIGWQYMAGGGAFSNYPMFLTLVNDTNVQFLQNMPMLELISSQYLSASSPSQGDFSTNGIVAIKPQIVVWPKSFLYFPAAPTFTGYAVQFQIFYK